MNTMQPTRQRYWAIMLCTAICLVFITSCNVYKKKSKNVVANYRYGRLQSSGALYGYSNGATQRAMPQRDVSSYSGFFDFSQAHNTESYAAIEENDFLKAIDAPQSTFSIDVDVASYSNIRRFINDGMMPEPGAVRIEEMINYFNYSYQAPEGTQPFSINTEVASCPWNPANHLLHIGLQGQVVATEDLPPSNLVFLLDVSGSMNYGNKLPLLKQSFRLLVNELTERDREAPWRCTSGTPGDRRRAR